MALEIRRIANITPEVTAAFARLVPQLSSRVRIPGAEWLRQVVSSPTSALFAACDGECILGVLTLAWYDVPSGRNAWIEDVVVDSAARGMGAGEALVRAALDQAAQLGADRLMLTSAAARTAARALYRKMGFEEAETSVFVLKK